MILMNNYPCEAKSNKNIFLAHYLNTEPLINYALYIPLPFDHSHLPDNTAAHIRLHDYKHYAYHNDYHYLQYCKDTDNFPDNSQSTAGLFFA